MQHEFKRSAQAIIAGTLAAMLAPAEPIMPSAWAAKNLTVPDGPYAGQLFKPEITPYLKEPLDFFSSDCLDNKQVIRKSKQSGFTTLAMGACGYIADVEPADVFLIEPTESNLSDFVNLKLQPTIDGSPTLARKVSPQISRSGKGSTTYLKRYPGGSLLMGIATSTADLRGKTRKIVIKDEASEYPDDLGGQGSPHDMISGSYESFLATGDWKEASISTPVVKGACYIDAEFERGDQRYWHMPCPGCGEKFVFTFDLSRFKFNDHYPHQAHYIAPCCGTVIEGHQKNELVRKGEWIAMAPAPGRHRSYHFDALSSPFVPWDVIAQRYGEAKDDPAKLKTFHNLTLGLAYEIKGDAPDHTRLLALREEYDRRRIPPRGLLLTAAADVQANGIYVEVVAFASNRETWTVEALFLDGDTTDPDAGAFAKLSQVYETVWPDSFGSGRRVDAFGVDSGFRSHVVYAWTRVRDGCFALKGGDGWQRPPIGTPTPVDIDLGGRKIKQGAAVWTVGTWSIKGQLYADLRKTRLAEGADVEPPGACHHGTWMDESYFVQLTNEYLAQRQFRGKPRQEWTERGPNHFLDCRVYNIALADYLGLSRLTQDEWARLAQLRGVPKEWQTPDLLAPEPVKVAAAATAPAGVPAKRQTPEAAPSRRSSVSSFMN